MNSMPPAAPRKWFPPSTLAEFLLLCILVGLVLAIWLQAKRDLSGPKEPVLLTLHENAPRAAIYGESGLRVVDCVTGKTLLKSPAIAYYKSMPPTDDLPWHVWPHSTANFAWTLKHALQGARVVTGFQTNIEPADSGDLTADGFEFDITEEKTIQLPEERSNPFHKGRPLRFLFSQDAATLVIRVRAPNNKYEYQIFHIESGRKTTYRNAAAPSGISPRMATIGACVVFADGDRQIDKLIDPAVGSLDPGAMPAAREALNQSRYSAPHFPIRAVDEQGRKVVLTPRPTNGYSLVAAPDIEGQEFIDWKDAKTIYSWEREPKTAWQSPDRLVIWTPDAAENESNVWIVGPQAPYLRRAAWPFLEQEDISQRSMEIDARGMTARRVRRNDPKSKENPESIYWDFENARVVRIPDDAERTRRYGDFIVAQTGESLQTIDLNSGRVIQTLSLKQEIRPPLTLAWLIWLAVWCFITRKADPKDLTRQVGAVSAIFFALLIALAYYYHAPEVVWLLNLLWIASLLLSLIVIAAARKASLISLAICGLLTLGLLFSGVQRGFASHPDDVFGPSTSYAVRLGETLTQSKPGGLEEVIEYLKAPWTTPQKTPLPAPQATLAPPN